MHYEKLGTMFPESIGDFNGFATTYVTGVMAAYMMEGYEIDDSNQHVKTFKLSEEIKGMKTYGKKSKKAQVDLMVTDRFHINLSMENQENWDEALEIIQEEMALDELVKL